MGKWEELNGSDQGMRRKRRRRKMDDDFRSENRSESRGMTPRKTEDLGSCEFFNILI